MARLGSDHNGDCCFSVPINRGVTPLSRLVGVQNKITSVVTAQVVSKFCSFTSRVVPVARLGSNQGLLFFGAYQPMGNSVIPVGVYPEQNHLSGYCPNTYPNLVLLQVV